MARHPNGAIGLVDIAIAVADVDEAAQRFARFTGRDGKAHIGRRRPVISIAAVFISSTTTEYRNACRRWPITALPFMIGYALRVRSLAAAEIAVERAGLDWHTFEDGITAAFPVELGEGAWFFVEDASELPWRR